MLNRAGAFVRQERLLVGLLLVGLLLRASGVFWGLPLFDSYARYYHPDEPKVIYGAYTFPRHVWANLDLRYPTAFHYMLGVAGLPLRLLAAPYDYYSIYMLGRAMSVLAGTATILVTWQLAQRLGYSRRSAGLAAFLIAFAMLHVTNSAWATTDVMLGFWMTLFFLLLPGALERGGRAALWAGVALGMCAGTKYTGVVAGIPLLILAVAQTARRSPGAKPGRILLATLLSRSLWTVGLVGAGVFLLSTPGMWLHPAAWTDSLGSETARLGQSYLPLYNPLVYGHQWLSLAGSLGWPLALAGLAGLGLVVARRELIPTAWLVMLVFTSLYLGNALLPRYLITFMPLWAILAGEFLDWLMRFDTAWLRRTGYVMTALVCLSSAAYSLAGAAARYPDTRSQAARYIKAHVSAGSSVGLGVVSDEFLHLWHYPRVDFDQFIKKDALKRPEYIILSSYDYEDIRSVLQRGLLNPDYSLPADYAAEWYRLQPPTPEQFRLNDALWRGADPQYCLLARFEPQGVASWGSWAPAIEFPAPTIEIYARRKPPGATSNLCPKP